MKYVREAEICKALSLPATKTHIHFSFKSEFIQKSEFPQLFYHNKYLLAPFWLKKGDDFLRGGFPNHLFHDWKKERGVVSLQKILSEKKRYFFIMTAMITYFLCNKRKFKSFSSHSDHRVAKLLPGKMFVVSLVLIQVATFILQGNKYIIC